MRELIRNILMLVSNYLFYKKNGKQDKAINELLYNNYLIYRKNKIIRYLEHEGGYDKEISCLKKQLPYLMSIDAEKVKGIVDRIRVETHVEYDKEKKMFFIIRDNKKLYMEKKLNSIDKVLDYYSYLAYEQTEESPHKYLGNGFEVKKGEIIADCGAAEGVFALDNIENADKVYLFEYDEDWIEALNATFEPYKGKAVIEKVFLNDYDEEDKVSLDTYFDEKDVSFIKMDLEGFEYKVLEGAKELLRTRDNISLAITVYHNKNDEKVVREYLKDYDISVTEGYLMHRWEEAEPPYLRHGVIRAKKV